MRIVDDVHCILNNDTNNNITFYATFYLYTKSSAFHCLVSMYTIYIPRGVFRQRLYRSGPRAETFKGRKI